MRVLIATGLYAPEIGGPATHTAILERELPKRGIAVTVLPFRLVRKFPKGIRHIVYFCAVVFHGVRADVIYALDPVSVGLPACLAAKLFFKKFVLRVPGDYAWEQSVQRVGITESPHDFASTDHGYPAFIVRLKYIQTFVAKRAHCVVVPSRYLKNIVVTWGVSPEKVHVVHSALDGIPELGNRRTLRGLLRFHGKFIISVGRLVPWKGFNLLIDIVNELKEKIPDIKLMIIGSGPEQEALEKSVAEKKLEEYIVIARPVERDVLARYIQAADVFVLNTFYEGFSHQLLEAMCTETPIVTTAVGGNPELISNEVNGLLVSYNNKHELTEAIVSLFLNTSKAKRMAERARRDVLNYSDKRMLDELIPLLK